MKSKKVKKQRWGYKNPKVLVLNKSYMPIDVCTWEEAITDWANGKATIEHTYENINLHSGYDLNGNHNTVMQCPSVIRLTDSFSSKAHMTGILPFSVQNLLERDKHKCCYCGCNLTLHSVTIEHVHPESKGGLTDWVNCRAACTKCNNAKGDKLLSELGWSLRTSVGIPTLNKRVHKSVIVKVGGIAHHESWKQYIYWSVTYK